MNDAEYLATKKAAEGALRGETHNTGYFVLPASATEITLLHQRIGAEKSVFLSPLSEEAALLRWWVDESTIQKGSVVVRFVEAPQEPAPFNFAVVGIQRTGVTDNVTR